jgi:hypothetical protein
MAALGILNPVIVNVQQSWPENATRSLIRYRRHYHSVFEDRSVRDHTTIWQRIANRVLQRNNFAVSAQQCRNKWYALKRGYENLRRMFDGNPDGFPVRSPNTYDARFYNELSDEFWLETGNYSNSKIKFIMFSTYQKNYLINFHIYIAYF